MTERTNAQKWADGAETALQLLDACYGDADAMTIDPRPHMGRPQNNAVLPFLERIAAERDPMVMAGFAAVLTDYISAAMEGGIRDVCHIETDVVRYARCAGART